MYNNNMSARHCVETGCKRDIVARGLCGMHYQRRRNDGTLQSYVPLPRPARTLSERFHAIGWTETNEGCWEWNGARTPGGYGMISSGKGSGGYRPLVASRVAWQLEYGDPGEHVICHACDNPPCVNPAHLFIGTKADNNRDMANKKRTRNGERRPQAKISDADVKAIRKRYTDGGISQAKLAREYGVTQSAISLIVSSKRRSEPTRW